MTEHYCDSDKCSQNGPQLLTHPYVRAPDGLCEYVLGVETTGDGQEIRYLYCCRRKEYHA